MRLFRQARLDPDSLDELVDRELSRFVLRMGRRLPKRARALFAAEARLQLETGCDRLRVTRDELAAASGLTLATARRARQDLQEAGLLESDPQGRNGLVDRLNWELLFGEPVQASGEPVHPESEPVHGGERGGSARATVTRQTDRKNLSKLSISQSGEPVQLDRAELRILAELPPRVWDQSVSPSVLYSLLKSWRDEHRESMQDFGWDAERFVAAVLATRNKQPRKPLAYMLSCLSSPHHDWLCEARRWLTANRPESRTYAPLGQPQGRNSCSS